MKRHLFLIGVLAGAGCMHSGTPAATPDASAAPPPARITNLLEHVVATMDAAVAGRYPVADRRLLLKHDDAAGVYGHNTNHPAFNMTGFTGISVLGTGANCSHNATVVSPVLVVTAGHCWQVIASKYYYHDGQGKGAEWRFLDREGKVHVAYAHNSRLLTNTITGRATDTRMLVLTKPLPDSIEPAWWGSPEFTRKAGGLGQGPCFIGSGDKMLWPMCPENTNYAAWNRGIRGGDSGSGSFVPFRNHLVYVGSFGGDMTAEGVNWRETAEWLCRDAGHKVSLPVEVDLRGVE